MPILKPLVWQWSRYWLPELAVKRAKELREVGLGAAPAGE